MIPTKARTPSMGSMLVALRSLAIAISTAIAAPVAAPHSLPLQEGSDPSPVQPGSTQDRPTLGKRGDGAQDREGMWFAPTAADWAKPCLITWQRTWEDAVALSQESGKPILVCTNMDGEIASEHYAGIRYRQPEIAAAYDPYVCVMASVYRHTPRDHDEEGHRILCPRFGSVTCGEHIAIEPLLFEKFFDGQRVAPRHIGVELNGEEMYDVFYAWDTASVFDAIQDGVQDRVNPKNPPARGDRPILERVASRDVRDRAAVESAYTQANREQKKSLLEAAIEHADAEPTDLLRLAVFGFDTELSQMARQALAKASSSTNTELISDALRVPMDTTERDGLIGALERIGENSPKARTLAVVHRGLSKGSDAVDVGNWSKALQNAEPPSTALESYEMEARLRDQNATLKSADPQAQVALAEAFLQRAFDSMSTAVDAREKQYTELLLKDAQRTARSASQNGAEGWRADSVLALTAYYLGDGEEALQRAASAVAALPAGDSSFQAMAVLELFAKMRWIAITEKVRDKEQWPPEWLTDVNSACAVLARHPLGTAAQVAWHYDVLRWLKADGQAARVIDHGIDRFPQSAALHERLRGRILAEKGIEGLESVYDEMLTKDNTSPDLLWYAGFACIVAAEFHANAGADDAAIADYERAQARFEQNIAAHPDNRDSADRMIVRTLAGRARIAFERENFDSALAGILAAFERKADAAADLDGLNVSAVDTAKQLLSRLKETERLDLAGRLQSALDALDPALLALPAYEDAVSPPVNRGGRPPRRDRGGN